MIFAWPQFDSIGEKIPATHWYYQVGNRWVAVDKDTEDYFGWFDEGESWPEPREYPINQLPPSGLLVYVDVSGVRRENVNGAPFVRFTNAVASLPRDGDVLDEVCRWCGYDGNLEQPNVDCTMGSGHEYDVYRRDSTQSWEILTGLIGEARDIVRAQLEHKEE